MAGRVRHYQGSLAAAGTGGPIAEAIEGERGQHNGDFVNGSMHMAEW